MIIILYPYFSVVHQISVYNAPCTLGGVLDSEGKGLSALYVYFQLDVVYNCYFKCCFNSRLR